jgi:hypothetical protein
VFVYIALISVTIEVSNVTKLQGTQDFAAARNRLELVIEL